jgi:hypothetical protein
MRSASPPGLRVIGLDGAGRRDTGRLRMTMSDCRLRARVAAARQSGFSKARLIGAGTEFGGLHAKIERTHGICALRAIIFSGLSAIGLIGIWLFAMQGHGHARNLRSHGRRAEARLLPLGARRLRRSPPLRGEYEARSRLRRHAPCDGDHRHDLETATAMCASTGTTRPGFPTCGSRTTIWCFVRTGEGRAAKGLFGFHG